MTMIKACPECDASAIRTRNPTHPSSPSHVTKKYRCRKCDHEFDEPRERKARDAGTNSNSALTAQLLATDPDDIDALNGGKA